MRGLFPTPLSTGKHCLGCSGNVDFDGLVETVMERPQRGRPAPVRPGTAGRRSESAAAGHPAGCTLPIADAYQAYSLPSASGPPMNSDDRYAARVLASIIGDEGGSRLFWELIDTGRAEVATVWPHEFTDTGVWFTYTICAPRTCPPTNASSIRFSARRQKMASRKQNSSRQSTKQPRAASCRASDRVIVCSASVVAG